jgi:hypothetical protein
MIKAEDDAEQFSIYEWYDQHSLRPEQEECIRSIQRILNSPNQGSINSMLDDTIPLTCKAFFCWTETRRLIEEIECPVHRFLIVASLHKDGDGFIHVRDITPQIAKLIYCIRCTVYVELMNRDEEEEMIEISLSDAVERYQEYVKELVQSPFGLLMETMHWASCIAGDSTALPQIVWLDTDFKALAIHGKKVELSQLQSLSQQLIQDVQRKFRREIKMGMPGLKDIDWTKWNSQDKLTEISNNYSYIHAEFKDQQMSLLNQFLDNNYTDTFFTRGRVRNNILWHKDNCVDWLKRCKQFLECLSVTCHLLGGQPARATEMATFRWINSSDEQRAMYWTQGTVMLLAQYSKTRSRTSQSRLIPRYL